MTFAVPLPGTLPWSEVRAGLVRAGFRRLLVGGQIVRLEALDKKPRGGFEVVADRLVARLPTKRGSSPRSSRRSASAKATPRWSSPTTNRRETYSDRARVPALRDPLPRADRQPVLVQQPARRLRSCRGFGRMIDIDLESDRSRSGASRSPTAPSSRGRSTATEWERSELPKLAASARHPDRCPVRALAPEHATVSPRRRGQVLRHPRLVPLARGPHLQDARARLPGALSQLSLCPACHGGRVRPDALDCKIAGKHVGEVNRMSVAEAAAFFAASTSRARRRRSRTSSWSEIRQRLGYLARGRPRLPHARPPVAHALGRRAGARRPHPRGRLLAGEYALHPRRAVGRPAPARSAGSWRSSRSCAPRRTPSSSSSTTQKIIREADHIIDLGPGAGERGGDVLFAGPYGDLLACRESLTAEYLTGRRRIAVPADAPRPTTASS